MKDNIVRLMFSSEIVECFYEQFNITEMTFDQLNRSQGIMVKIVDEHEKQFALSMNSNSGDGEK